MTPFGISLSRDDFGFDPALDDGELARARDSLLRGRWADARTLLAETGDDWDRRSHRLVVLARAAAAADWARDWQLAEPDSADAGTLYAHAAVRLAARGKERPAVAERACRAAALMAPADPSPWLGLLILARYTGTDDERMRAFDHVRGRYPWHHQAHHLMATCLAERQKDLGDDPFHEVYEFAEWAASEAPAGSPLAVLPLVAHAERFRVLAAAGAQHKDPAKSGFWDTWRARKGIETAFHWWLEWDGARHPRLKIDLNFLAHAKFHEGRMAEAAVLFNTIGPHATRSPWAYVGRDPKRSFRTARARALGLVSRDPD